MIILQQRQHNHHQVTKHQDSNQNATQNSYEQSPQFFKILFKQTQIRIHSKSIQQITNLTRNRQKKVYQSLIPHNDFNYLAVMFEKTNPSQQQQIQALLQSREDQIMSKILADQITIKEHEDNDKKIKRIKNQLDEKIKSMKIQLGDFISEENQSKTDQQDLTKSHNSLLLIQDFKKKKYWEDKEFSEKGKRVKSFLFKMKRQKSQNESKFTKDLQNTSKKLDQKDSEQKNKIKEQRHKQYMENLEKQYKQKSHKRKEYFESKSQKINEVSKFLKSINPKEPLYRKYQKEFKDFLAKEEESRQNMLKQIKQKHPAYNAQQVQEHMNKYNEMKERYYQEKEKKAQTQEQLLISRFNKLKNLYHSQHHETLIDSKKVKDLTHEELTQNRQKVKSYANTVKQSFKPIIDTRKRKQFLENMKIMQFSHDPTKRRVIKASGQIHFEDRQKNDAYEKGVSYLQQLRDFNEVNKSRISSSRRYDRSNSALELTSPKRINYLRESRPSIDLKPTISDWKKLLTKKDYTNKDKIQRVLDRAQSLELHAKQKQVQLRNMRNSQHAISVRQQSDKYYLSSISARMVLLKDVVMK